MMTVANFLRKTPGTMATKQPERKERRIEFRCEEDFFSRLEHAVRYPDAVPVTDHQPGSPSPVTLEGRPVTQQQIHAACSEIGLSGILAALAQYASDQRDDAIDSGRDTRAEFWAEAEDSLAKCAARIRRERKRLRAK